MESPGVQDKEALCGITRCSLSTHAGKSLWMVVVRHGKRELLALITTRRVSGRRPGERYLDWWACEEGSRFTEQGSSLEGVQARRLATPQNLAALASLAWALLAAHLEQAAYLLRKAKRQKPGRSLQCRFYSLLQGWQRLFAPARRIVYHGWRERCSRSPVCDLFQEVGLAPPGTG